MSGLGMSGLPKPRSMTSLAGVAGLVAQLVDDREHVGRQPVDPAELHEGPGYRTASAAPAIFADEVGASPRRRAARRSPSHSQPGHLLQVLDQVPVPGGAPPHVELDGRHGSGKRSPGRPSSPPSSSSRAATRAASSRTVARTPADPGVDPPTGQRGGDHLRSRSAVRSSEETPSRTARARPGSRGPLRRARRSSGPRPGHRSWPGPRQQDVGEESHPADQRPEADPRRDGRHRGQHRHRRQRGPVRPANGEQVVEAEHAVEPSASARRSRRGPGRRVGRTSAGRRRPSSFLPAVPVAPASEEGGADGAGLFAQPGGDDVDRRAVVEGLHQAGEGRPNRLEQDRPAPTSPPPMTIVLGSKTLARLASPRASHQAKLAITAVAPGSPSAAARVTCSPRTASGSPPASSTRRGAAPTSAASRPSRPRPLPEAKRSQQPRLPQGQRGPWGSMTMCPNSPAKPLAPSWSRPLATIPPPMPVPRVTMSTSSRPCAAPRTRSAQPAQLASLATRTDDAGNLASSPARMGRPTIAGRLGAKRSTPSLSTKPGAPTPTSSPVRPGASLATTPATASSSSSPSPVSAPGLHRRRHRRRRGRCRGSWSPRRRYRWCHRSSST